MYDFNNSGNQSHGDTQAELLNKIKELDLGHTRLVKGDSGPKEEVKVATSIDEYEGNFHVPKIGAIHPSDPDLIDVNSMGWFNMKTLRFVNEPTNLSKETLKDTLRLIGWLEADELFLQEDEPLKIKLGHRTRAVTKLRYSTKDLIDSVGDLVDKSIPGRITSGKSEPFATSVAWINKKAEKASLRFRGNGTRTQGNFGNTNGVTFAIRRLGDKIPTMDELKLTQAIRKVLFPKTGIVIIAGETGSGKSTLCASVLGSHIANAGIVLSTYEYPVEFDFRPSAHPDCVVGQTDLSYALGGSYAEAVKDAMRRNSDIVFIGEVRDLDSAYGAISLALSGHLVYCTFHAGSPMEAMDRIISYFPVDQQSGIRNALIGTLQTVVCVKLVPTLDEKRVQIRGYLNIDQEMRSEMYSLDRETFVKGIKDLYQERGHTMRADLALHKDSIAPEVYEQYEKVFH